MVFIITAVVACLLDRAVKFWVTSNIALGEVKSFIPGVMSLTDVHNSGAAFSMLSGHTWLLALVSVVACAVLLFFILRKGLSFREKMALSVILGGAMGNAIDRIFMGYVVDMFRVDLFNYAIFNLADAMIDVGAVLFVIFYLVRTIRRDRAGGEESEKTEDRGDDN